MSERLALTLWPEWAYAVAHLGKDVENRSWPPPQTVIRKRIAIHGGASIGGGSSTKAGFARFCLPAPSADQWESGRTRKSGHPL